MKNGQTAATEPMPNNVELVDWMDLSAASAEDLARASETIWGWESRTIVVGGPGYEHRIAAALLLVLTEHGDNSTLPDGSIHLREVSNDPLLDALLGVFEDGIHELKEMMPVVPDFVLMNMALLAPPRVVALRAFAAFVSQGVSPRFAAFAARDLGGTAALDPKLTTTVTCPSRLFRETMVWALFKAAHHQLLV